MVLHQDEYHLSIIFVVCLTLVHILVCSTQAGSRGSVTDQQSFKIHMYMVQHLRESTSGNFQALQCLEHEVLVKQNQQSMEFLWSKNSY